MTVYKGHVINMVWSNFVHPKKSDVPDTIEATDKDWVKGSILLIIATLAWASFFILQVPNTYCVNSARGTMQY